MIKVGQRYITNGGWQAVVCNDSFCTVFHEVNGGVLYSHNKDGTVRSGSVGREYDLDLDFQFTAVE